MPSSSLYRLGILIPIQQPSVPTCLNISWSHSDMCARPWMGMSPKLKAGSVGPPPLFKHWGNSGGNSLYKEALEWRNPEQ